MADRSSIIDKVKARVSKTTANGCTEQEMFSALAKARALQDAYDISDDELQLSREEKAVLHDESEANAPDSHKIKWNLSYGVARFCAVRVFRDRRKPGLTFVGLMSDIEYATWLLDHLSDFVHQALFEHLLDCDRLAPQDRKEEIRGFVIGCTGRIEDRLIEICNRSNTARTVNGNALVVIKDRAIDDFMKCNGISPKNSRRSSAAFSEGARAAGQSAGNRADFARPVSGAGAVLRIGE